MPHKLSSICVFCGSSKGKSDIYAQHAEQLGKLFAKEQIRLVYGGGSIGIMGILARSVQSNGGSVFGVIPHALKKVSGDAVGSLVIVDTMHDRKAKMSEEADAFIALPGGFGTMEELVEAITWSQLRIHAKPIGVLNTRGFFDSFVKWLDKAVEEGFIDQQSRRLVVVCEEPEDLLRQLTEYEDPIMSSEWILKNDMWKKQTIHLSDI